MCVLIKRPPCLAGPGGTLAPLAVRSYVPTYALTCMNAGTPWALQVGVCA